MYVVIRTFFFTDMDWLFVLKDQYCMFGALSLVFKTNGKNFLNQGDVFGRILTCRLQKQITYVSFSIR